MTATGVLTALLGACGGDAPTTLDAAPIDATAIDAEVPDAGPPPACLAPAVGPAGAPCRECLVGPRLADDASLCTAEICAIDAGCCSDLWDERCTELADARCGLTCVNAISFGGYQSQTVGRWDGAGFATSALISTPDLYIESIAWADFDGDGDVDLATSGECTVRIRRNDGWSGDLLDLPSVYDEQPIADCPTSGRFGGHRARWHDLDRDGDLDVAMAGEGGGAFWIRYATGAFTRADDIVPAADGTLTDLALADLDGDGDVDAIAGFGDGPARLYRHDGTSFSRDVDWQAGPDQSNSIDLCDLAGDGRRELLISGFGGTAAYTLSGGEISGELFPVTSSGGTDIACSDLDGDGKDELIAVSPGGPVFVHAGTGATIWRSDVDLAPPASFASWGVDAGDLDGDGDVDLVVSGDPADEPKDIHLFWNTGADPLDFAYQLVADFLSNHDMRSAEMLYLPAPP